MTITREYHNLFTVILSQMAQIHSQNSINSYNRKRFIFIQIVREKNPASQKWLIQKHSHYR
jgi:hypothetical protein